MEVLPDIVFFGFVLRRDSKAVRFNDHLPKIRNEHIHLPEFAIRREALVAEIVAFRGEFDDQIDAMTLDLDFIDTDLTIPRGRESASHFPSSMLLRWRRH